MTPRLILVPSGILWNKNLVVEEIGFAETNDWKTFARST